MPSEDVAPAGGIARGQARQQPRGARLILLLAAFTLLAPLVTDLYLPVLPELAGDLRVPQASAQATVSVVLLGLAVGQLVAGPLSDAWGRRRPALAGGALFVAAGIACAAAPGLASLLVFRFVAGLATAACVVVARAVVTDTFSSEDAPRAYATLAVVVTAVPAVAPVGGGLLALVTGWRGMFGVLAACGLVVLLVGARAFPETLPSDRRRPAHLGHALRDLAHLLRDRAFVGSAGGLATAGGILFSWIAASSFVLQDRFHLSPTAYSLVFGLNAAALFAVAALNRALLARRRPEQLLSAGQAAGLVGIAVVAAGVWRASFPLLEAGLLMTVGSLGLVIGNAMALGMRQAPDRAGSASGLLGILQFLGGSLAALAAGFRGSPWSLVVVLAVCAVLGVLLRLVRPVARRTASMQRPQ